ncbi:hypothetical protein Tco_1413733 [Tanacetum coccineum]
MHDAYTAAQKHIAELEAGNSNLTHKIQKDDNDEMIKHFSKLEVEHLNLQLKYQHLKELNALQDLNKRFRVENEKVKQHYKELYDSIKLTHAKTIEKTNSLLAKIENLNAQIKGKMTCVTMPADKLKVLTPGMYAIDVESIPSRNRNNREVHLDYLKHLRESVETLREIVEEDKVEKPLDRSLASACLYTKHSQELLEYVIGTCPKHFNKRDRKIATAPLNKKKRVTFVEPGVKDSTAASGSKPRSNTKKDKTLPAKSDMKKVEDHSRNNKSSVKQTNRADYSIIYKRTVKQVWQATGKLFTNVRFQWQPTERKFTLGERRPLTRFTISKVVPVKQLESVSTSEIMITERLSNTSQKPLTRTLIEIGDPTYQTLHIRLFSNAGRTDRPLVFGLRLFKTYDGGSLAAQEFCKKVHWDG